MAKVTLKKVSNGITDHLNGMLDRSRALQGFLARNIYREYQNAQRERWMTEGQSEGDSWQPLDAKYMKRKTSQFQSYPGAGRKMMIATSKLQGSVIGMGDYGVNFHRVLTGPKSLEISTTLDYAPYPAEKRPFMVFSDRTLDEWNAKIADFIAEARQ